MADLVEYCWGDAYSTTWGKIRTADGHPEPYRLQSGCAHTNIGLGGATRMRTPSGVAQLLRQESCEEWGVDGFACCPWEFAPTVQKALTRRSFVAGTCFVL